MKAKIQKWGNSRAVRIPMVFATEGHFDLDAEVDMKLEHGELRIVPLHKKQTLRELLEGITPQNIHSETETGLVVGHEIW